MQRLSLPLVLTLACLTALSAPAGAATRPTPAQAQRALAAAEAIFDAGASAGAAATGPPDATLAMRDLALALPVLEGSDRRRAKRILGRPNQLGDRDYFGPEDPSSPICDARFCIHWSVRPSDAPSGSFVNDVVDAADHTYAIENTALGWKDAKSDGSIGHVGGAGNSGQVDVYLEDLPNGLYGFSAPDPGQSGRSRYAYLVLENDYDSFSGNPVKLMQATMAHEYNHVLQFNYDSFEDTWIFEATATWMEPHVYPAITDFLNFLPPFAHNPDTPLDSPSKMYGSAVWNHWLTSRYGPDVVRRAWAGSPAAGDFAFKAYDNAIGALGGPSLDKEFAHFTPVTAEWNASDAFPDAASYPDMKRFGPIGRNAVHLTLDHTAYKLLNVGHRGGSTVGLKVKVKRGVQAGIALVGRNGSRTGGTVMIASKFLGKGGSGRLVLPNPGRFERITAVLTNADARVNFLGRFKSDNASFKAHLTG